MNEAGPSDERLGAELKKWTGTAPALHPVGELLDRHWEAAFTYARLCTGAPRAAGMLTTAAFTRLFGESLRHSGPSAAWRPEVLVTVRRIAAEWDNDDRRGLLHPALRSGERAAALLRPSPGRRLLSRAFQQVPGAARAVLWHTEVEADPLSVPAVLLGRNEEDVRLELRRARERLREECLQVHRELAPETECRRYLRLLDVTYRRGGVDVDPDLRAHLSRCAHCGRTAGQLAEFATGLGPALAETVLGWGARAYVESRTSRADAPAEPVPAPSAVMPGAGEPFATPPPGRGPAAALSPRYALRVARRARRRHLALAAVTVCGLVALPLVLWSVLGSDRAPAPAGTATPAPGGSPAAPSPSPTWAGAGHGPRGTPHGRLRNLASGLCVGITGKRVVTGAETVLTACSTTPGQQWTYETDGLLRNAADPGLCLDSRLGYSVRLASCTATGTAARALRYDLTSRGALVPRLDPKLALTPAATDGSGALVTKIRATGSAQRWSIDAVKVDLDMRNVNWGSDSAATPRRH
ncbi:ricin-type beta-trefoil lectin domain protein [Streptomyces sp. LP11]|uniref:Ricin-type beta-trefoil lectin domain protein n=1 Tax=Streptomyces pyxinicus TaxID=2970331 RepID=A0ABT2BAC1_9ACTN|nr:ricin-type beta-trefoil lectin domain protein [Streptomyces sp. LP11]MCS0605459.1 ricin-type beta-trefoil lectin domain protein [Streptomyces sp. LP11]